MSSPPEQTQSPPIENFLATVLQQWAIFSNALFRATVQAVIQNTKQPVNAKKTNTQHGAWNLCIYSWVF